MISPLLYVLDANGNPAPEPNPEAWSQWILSSGLAFHAWTELGEFTVSTLFTGMIDISNGEERPPKLWQTMIIGGSFGVGEFGRCSGGREQAEAQHRDAVELVKRSGHLLNATKE